ncbi:hypothetical protein HYW20_07040 [Candidatus Woesearchaeota archaeon]|nr:hypothetical protein [Candidatus Woesearchaeota archaeon]
MKNAWLFGLLLLISAIIMTACESVDVSKLSDQDLQRISEKVVVCNSPYIRFGPSCCLDKNNNTICDNDEKNENVPREESPKAELVSECMSFSEIWEEWMGAGILCNMDKDCEAYIAKIDPKEEEKFECKPTKYVKYQNPQSRNFVTCNSKEDCTKQIFDGGTKEYLNQINKSLEKLSPDEKTAYYILASYEEIAKCNNNFCEITEGLTKQLSQSGKCIVQSNTCTYCRADIDKCKTVPMYDCKDECSTSFCSGFSFVDCEKQADGCKKKVTKGIIKGECEVECTKNSDCESSEECKNYKCEKVPESGGGGGGGGGSGGGGLVVKDTLKPSQTKTYTINGKDYEVTITKIYLNTVELMVNGMSASLNNYNPSHTFSDGTKVKSISVVSASLNFELKDAIGSKSDTIRPGEKKMYTLNGKDYEIELNSLMEVSVKLTINGVSISLSNSNPMQTLWDGTKITAISIVDSSISFELGG